MTCKVKNRFVASKQRQSGVVLLVSLLILLLITVVGFAMMDTSNLEVKMASTKELKTIAFQTAESILEESLTEPDAVNLLGQSLNAFLADPNDPVWPRVDDFSYDGYDSGTRNVAATGAADTSFLGTQSTIGYSIRKGSSGIETYYYEVESNASTSNANIGSTHIQGVYIEAPRVN
ncbi:MAG: type IV pilus assembly protein PilX [Halieaceae bacterium]|jgi:Tfp pilus assembly protein PilX